MTGVEMDDLLRGLGRELKDLTRILHKVQAEYGCIPAEAIQRIARHLNTTESEIYGVLTFYKAFRLQPGGKHLVTVCQGTSCHVRGGPGVFDEMKKELGVEPGETTPDRHFSLETVRCLGACGLAPVVVVDEDTHRQMKPSKITGVLGAYDK